MPLFSPYRSFVAFWSEDGIRKCLVRIEVHAHGFKVRLAADTTQRLPL